MTEGESQRPHWQWSVEAQLERAKKITEGHKPESFTDVELKAGKWLHLRAWKFQTQTGHDVLWEYACRPGSSLDASKIEGVEVVPFLEASKKADGFPRERCLILILNFRAPIQEFVVEFPAGLLDPGETDPFSAAVRELKEETGFSGTPIKTPGNPVMTLFTDPWKSSEKMGSVSLTVDPDLPENANPQQQLEREECIEVLVLPVKGLRQNLESIVQKFGYGLDAKLYKFAQGLEYGLG
eukprot:Clim_evm19s207 gene=Clim_evmTU19s207